MAATAPDIRSLPAMALVGETLSRDPAAFLSVHDGGGSFTFATSSVDVLTGWQPPELAGRSLYEFVHPDDVEAVRDAHGRSSSPPANEEVTFRMRDRRGAYVRVASRSWGTPGPDGQLQTVVCLTTRAS